MASFEIEPHATDKIYDFNEITNHPRKKNDPLLYNKITQIFVTQQIKSKLDEIIDVNKKINNSKKNLIADVLDRYLNDLEMAFEPNKIINIKINENNVNLIAITKGALIILIGDLEDGSDDDNVVIIKNLDYMINLNDIQNIKITTFKDNYNVISFKVGEVHLIVNQQSLIYKLQNFIGIPSTELTNYLNIITKFEIVDFKFVNKFTSLLNKNNINNTGIIEGLRSMFYNMRDEKEIQPLIFLTNILSDFYRESYPHHDSPMNMLFKENNSSIANYFKVHGCDNQFQTTFMTKLFNKYNSVLKIYGIILIEKINNVISKYRQKFATEIFDIIKESDYIIGEQALKFGHIKNFLLQQFLKNDGKIDTNSIKFLIPYFTNIFGYYRQFAPENKIFEIDIKNKYEIPLINDLEKFTEFGNLKSEDKANTYIDPISHDEINISDPNARIIFSNNTSYVFDCNYLIEVIETTAALNPITGIPFTPKEKHYIRFGNIDLYEESAEVSTILPGQVLSASVVDVAVAAVVLAGAAVSEAREQNKTEDVIMALEAKLNTAKAEYKNVTGVKYPDPAVVRAIGAVPLAEAAVRKAKEQKKTKDVIMALEGKLNAAKAEFKNILGFDYFKPAVAEEAVAEEAVAEEAVAEEAVAEEAVAEEAVAVEE